jgi:hypothetical protein
MFLYAEDGERAKGGGGAYCRLEVLTMLTGSLWRRCCESLRVIGDTVSGSTLEPDCTRGEGLVVVES